MQLLIYMRQQMQGLIGIVCIIFLQENAKIRLWIWHKIYRKTSLLCKSFSGFETGQVIRCNYNGSNKKVLKKLKSSWRMSNFRFVNAHKVRYASARIITGSTRVQIKLQNFKMYFPESGSSASCSFSPFFSAKWGLTANYVRRYVCLC